MLKQRQDEKTDREKEKNGRENPGQDSRVARGAEEQKITAVPSVWNC